MSVASRSPVLSADGSSVVFQWQSAARHTSLRMLDLSRPGTSATVLVENPEIPWLEPLSWSPDGQWIAVQFRQQGAGRLAVVSTTGNILRPLKSIEWRVSTAAFFSPDGKELAYDVPADETSDQRDVRMISIDGTRDRAVVTHAAHDRVIGWAPDGGALIFASDRGGPMALWALSLESDRPVLPVLLKPDLGRLVTSYGVTATGALVYAAQVSAQTVRVAEVDFATGRLLAPPTDVAEAFYLQNEDPAWAPDGTLVYRAERTRGGHTFVVRNRDGSTRQIVPGANGRGLEWHPNGTLTVWGEDRLGRSGIHSLDPQTGRATPIIQGFVAPTFFWSRDGSSLYYRRIAEPGGHQTVVLRQIATGAERELPIGQTFAPSWDDQRVAFFETDRRAKRASLFVQPLAASGRTLLHEFSPMQAPIGFLRWTPDGRHIVFVARHGDDLAAFSIPSAGGAVVKLDPAIPGHNSIAIHPDGRRVAYEGGVGSVEVWTLERFLPGPAGR